MLPVYDLVGIGFGPANLTLAIAAEERAEKETGRGPRIRFFDKGGSFSWHPGMLFDTSALQVSFLKDLVTMRNPRSRYSFLNYLYEDGRIHDFINLRTFFPPRIEFDRYYRWAAQHFGHLVDYGCTVRSIEPEHDHDNVRLLRVTVDDPSDEQPSEVLARNISVGIGGSPRIPPGVHPAEHGRIFHSGETLLRLGAQFPDIAAPYEFVVVGAGQTAGDVIHYLISTYPNAHITSAIRGFGFKPQDDTHFVNELFHPEAVDMWYELPDDHRGRLREEHKEVTHSAMDMDLIPQIYDAFYRDKMSGRGRLRLQRFSELVGAWEDSHSTEATFCDVRTNAARTQKADALILATGYDHSPRVPLLENLEPWLVKKGAGYSVRRDYSVTTVDNFEPNIFMLGFAEPSHGFSETLLSLMPLRAEEIFRTVSERAEDIKAHDCAPGQ